MPTAITRGAASALALGWSRISNIVDQYFPYVTMLIPGNGTNGAQNNTFTDSSANAFTVTRNGNTAPGTDAPFGPYWSNYFNGTTDYQTVPDNTAFDFAAGEWTVECWIFRTGGGGRTAQVVYNQSVSGATSNSAIYLGAGSDGFSLYLSTSGTAWTNNIETATAAVTSTWNHVVWQRRGNTLEIYLNGVVQTVASGSATFSGTIFNSSRNIEIGTQGGTGSFFTGMISNLRVVKGTAVYTANFTPPTAPLTAISGTSLLTCQSNRFIDNSTNAFTITATGTPNVQRFSPFNPASSYNTWTYGGSAYFDGSGDNLNIAASANLNVTGGAFTIEAWIYASSVSSGQIVAQDDGGSAAQSFQFRVNGSKLSFVYWTTSSRASAVTAASTNNVPTNRWTHVAVCYTGTQLYLFINGAQEFSGAVASMYSGTNNATGIGNMKFPVSAADPFTGFITNVRILKGTALYTAAFTPPSTPLTAITNTQLLLLMTDAAIIDNAMISNIETVGNAQISTAQSKFGGSSVAFDGTGDWLSANGPNLSNAFNQLTAASGKGTIEMWVYINSFTSPRSHILGAWSASVGWTYDFTTSGDIAYTTNGASTTVTLSSKFTTGSWQFLTITNNGTTVTIYRNGTSVGSFSVASPTSYTGPLTIGTRSDNTLSYNGYIDDLRITRGYVRYSGNFTPPTAPFPVQ